MGHARALLALPAVKQVEIARLTVAKALAVAQGRVLIAGLAKPAAANGRAKVDRDIARLEEEVSQRLGTTVKIQTGLKPGSGKLVIQYATLDQLDALLRKLN